MAQHQRQWVWWLVHAVNVIIAVMLWFESQQLSLRDRIAAFGIIALVYIVYMRQPFLIGAWASVQWSPAMKLKVATANAVTFMIYGLAACLFPVDFQNSYASIIGVISGLMGMLLMYLPPVHSTFSIGFHIQQSRQATKAMLLFMGRGSIGAGVLIMIIGNAMPDVLMPVAWGLILFVLIGGPVYGQHLDRRRLK